MLPKFSLVCGLFLLLAGGTGYAAQDGDSRLARLSYIDGNVSFQHAGDVDWSAATVNLAIQPSDRIYTAESGRAEIEFDDGSVVRLAEKTDIQFLALKEELIQIRVSVGLASLTVRSGVEFEFDTPAAAFTALRKGNYRFDVMENGDTDGIVRKGLLEAANSEFSRQLQGGELIHVTAGAPSTSQLARYDRSDPWDQWTDRRDADAVVRESRAYLPDNVYMGVRELDRYGRWVVVDNYGPAWVPLSVDSFWSPYWEGRWYYRPFWGWTWASYEPWGWLPYHYGSWYHTAAFGWCWIPGPAFGFHFWSPGLVRFSVGPSWVSWVPLGPGDYYNPRSYHYSAIYNYQVNNFNQLHVRPAGDLINRNAPGALRVVTADQFVNGSFGRQSRMSEIIGTDQLKQGRMVVDALAVQPTARSFAPAPDRPALRPREMAKLPTVVRTPAAGLAAERMIVVQKPLQRQERSGTGGTSLANQAPATVAPQSTPLRSEPAIQNGRPWNRRSPESSGETPGRALQPGLPQPRTEEPRKIWNRAPESSAPQPGVIQSTPQRSAEPGRVFQTPAGGQGGPANVTRPDPIPRREMPSGPPAQRSREMSSPPSYTAPRSAPPQPRMDRSFPAPMPRVQQPAQVQPPVDRMPRQESDRPARQR